MTPFFSVALPTKNRSHIVGDAIRCVLNQTFDDYELVVMDNSDDDKTYDVVKGFNDPRLLYHRSGGLPMADNWEAALRETRGEYLTIIEDKQLLYPRALDTIYQAVEKDRPLSVHWYVDAINNTVADACVFSNLYGHRETKVEYISSIDMLNNFMEKGHYFAPYDLPKGFNSVTYRSLAKKIRSGPGGRLCLPVAPDCTMGYIQVAYVDQVLRINQSLSAIAWAGGNGVTYTLKDKKGIGLQFIKQSGENNMHGRMPIATPMLVTNIVFNDFFNTRDLVGGHLNEAKFDMATYFALSFEEIVRREKMGVDMSDEQTAWDTAFEQQPAAVKSAIRRAIVPHQQQRAQIQHSQLMRKFGITRVIGKVMQITGASASALAAAQSVPKFPDVLAAVDWEARGEYTGVFASQN